MELKDKAESIRMVLDRQVDVQQTEELLTKLNDLINISGLSAEIVPIAKLKYRNAQERVILDLMENPISLNATTTNDLVKARTGKEEAFLQYAEGLSRKIGYAMESLRSIISMRKQELSSNI